MDYCIFAVAKGGYILQAQEGEEGGIVMDFRETKATTTKRIINQCAQCGDKLLAPVWSEYVKERCVRHLWNCDACGYAFETTVYFAPETAHIVEDAA